jgi:uncharacterized membrane protein
VDPEPISIVVDAPQELVYDFLLDIANYPSFTDHFLVDWHLTRERSTGLGAGARFRIAFPLARFAWADLTFTAAERPRLIVAEGRMGKVNRVPLRVRFELRPGPEGTTRLTVAVGTEPRIPSDRLGEAVAGPWARRQLRKAVVRVRELLEEAARQGGLPPTVKRVTVADG